MERERERQTDGESEREGGKERERHFNGSGFSGLNFDDVHNALKSFLIGPRCARRCFLSLNGISRGHKRFLSPKYFAGRRESRSLAKAAAS